LFHRRAKIIAGMNNEEQRLLRLKFAGEQIIGA
jgi:hypothetical protein